MATLAPSQRKKMIKAEVSDKWGRQEVEMLNYILSELPLILSKSKGDLL